MLKRAARCSGSSRVLHSIPVSTNWPAIWLTRSPRIGQRGQPKNCHGGVLWDEGSSLKQTPSLDRGVWVFFVQPPPPPFPPRAKIFSPGIFLSPPRPGKKGVGRKA